MTDDLMGGKCCLTCMWLRQEDGYWCAYRVDSEGNEVWEEVRAPEDHGCNDWEET